MQVRQFTADLNAFCPRPAPSHPLLLITSKEAFARHSYLKITHYVPQGPLSWRENVTRQHGSEIHYRLAQLYLASLGLDTDSAKLTVMRHFNLDQAGSVSYRDVSAAGIGVKTAKCAAVITRRAFRTCKSIYRQSKVASSACEITFLHSGI